MLVVSSSYCHLSCMQHFLLPRFPLTSHKKERRLGSAEADCTLLAKVDWRSGKVAADDDGILSPRLEGPLYVMGTHWLAEGTLNLDTPVTGTLVLPDGTHKRLRVSTSVICH